MTKLSACNELLDAPARHFFLLLEHRLERRAGVDAEGLDLQLALIGRPARAVLQRGGLGREFAGQSQARAGDRVLDQPPADLLLPRLDGGGQRRALRRAHHAGDRILVPRLVGLHGRHQPLAEFAVDRAGEVAAPGQVVLDRHALGRRDRGVGVLQARRLAGGCACGGAAGGRGLGFGGGLSLRGFCLGTGGVAIFSLGLGLASAWLGLASALASGLVCFLGSLFGSFLAFASGLAAGAASAAGAGLARGSLCASAAELPKITAKIAAKTRMATPNRYSPHPSRKRPDAPMMRAAEVKC